MQTFAEQFNYVHELFAPEARKNEAYAAVLNSREETGPLLWAMIQTWPTDVASQVLKVKVAKYCREFAQGVTWCEALLAEMTPEHPQWWELQQLRIYCYEFDYELATALEIVERLIAQGYEQKLWRNQAALLYKLHQTQQAVVYLQTYAQRADEEQLASIDQEVAKYTRYLEKGKLYTPMYQKGDKTLQSVDAKQLVVLKERVVHDSPFSLQVLRSSSNGNLSLLHVAGTYYLIDCGVSKSHISQMLAENGIHLNDLAGIFITHSHSDHVKGLAMLTKYHHMPVHLSAETAAEITQRKDFQRSGRTRNLQIWTEHTFTLGQLQVTILPTSHDTTDSCGFKFSYQGQSLVYLTDLGTADHALLQQAKGAHCYVFESNHEPDLLAATNRPAYLKKRIASDLGHLNNTQSAQYLQQLMTEATKTIVLAHLSLEANTAEQATQIFHTYNADFTGTLYIAQADDAISWIEIGE